MITFLHGKLVESLPTRHRGRERHRLRGADSFVVIRQIAPARRRGETAHATHRPRRRAHSLRLRDGGGARFISAAHQQRQRHRPENRVEHFERHERGGVSRRGGERRREIASQISGVGKKTAERIVVELRDKIGAAGALEAASAKHSLSPDDQKTNDATLALMALGFKQIEAHDSVRAAQTMLGAAASVEQLVRACLKKEHDG